MFYLQKLCLYICWFIKKNHKIANLTYYIKIIINSAVGNLPILKHEYIQNLMTTSISVIYLNWNIKIKT